MKKDIKTVLKNFTYLVITKGIDFVIPLLMLPFLVATLGIDGFGKLSFALAIGIYFTAIMQYGFSITAVREIARVRHDAAKLAETFSIILFASILLVFGGSVLFSGLFIIDSLASQWPLFGSTLLFIATQSLFPSWFFQGIEKMKYIAISNSMVKITYVIAVFSIVRNPEHAYLVPLLQGVAGLIGLLIAWYVIHTQRLTYLVRPKWTDITATYLKGWPAFVTQIAPTLYTNSMTFILGLQASAAVVGIFSAAARIIDIFNAIAFLLSNAFLPFLARDISQHKWVRWLLIVAGIGLSLMCYFGAFLFVPLMFNDHQESILAIVQGLSPMIFFIFLRFTYGPGYLMLVGKDKPYQYIVLVTAVLAFCGAWVSIPIWSSEAATVVMVSASAVMALLTFGYAQSIQNLVKEGAK